jgi:hypothetical protein
MKKIIVIFLLVQFSTACTRKLENSSEKMAETSTALQQSTQVQMERLLSLIEQLTKSIGALENNFLSLIIIMQSMQLDLNELSNVSEPVRSLITQMNSTLTNLFQKSESPDLKTDDIGELLGDK